MAKITYNILAGAVKGSVQGVTFSGGRFGPVFRTKPIPVRRERSGQPANRNIIGYLSRYWGQNLTAGERLLWLDYANAHPRVDSLGQTYKMTAANAFTSLSSTVVRLFGIGSLIDSPPVVPPEATIATLVASDGIAGGAVVLTWTVDGTGLAADKIEVQVNKSSASPGQNVEMQSFADTTTKAGNTFTATIAGLLIGAWYWFRVRYVDQFGQVTGWIYAQWQAPAAP